MGDGSALESLRDGRSHGGGRRSRWNCAARCGLALMVGAAGVLGILTGVAGGVNAALWRGGVWGLVAGMGLPVWIAVAFMLGGGAARVVSRTDRMPGWLGIGTAWLYAAGSVVLLPRWVTPLPDFPLLFNVVVLPVFSWYGDDFAWRVLYGRKAREVDARRRNGYRDC